MAYFNIESCPFCGEEINYMANTCYECGEDLPEGASFCPHCGEEVDDDGLICEECGEVISEEDVEKYNQLSQEEKTALREAYLQKKSEEMAADEAMQKELEEKRRRLEEKRRRELEQLKISKDQDEALINEVTDFIKSHISFDCKLKVSLTFTYIEIRAKIADTAYSLSARILQKDKATALPKFVKALIALHEIVG
jgi:transcription initiation factor TFIIIB Brf1 subunit/transcription initiation factor TFIIB